MLLRRCVLVLTAVAVTGCAVGREPTPTVMPPPPVATAVPLPTNTPEPTSTAAPTATAGPAAVSELPADPDAVVVQFARIEHRPWEPDILAQMTPNFSLQSDGYLVYQYPGGPSRDGWYQTVITPTNVAAFVRKLADDIGVLDIADRRGEPAVRFGTAADGSPADTEALGVIYVQTADRSGRLVIDVDDLEHPTGPDAERIGQLLLLINALQLWRRGTDSEFSPEQRAAIAGILGWWADPRQPYTPTSGVAFGTRARRNLPADAVTSLWPLADSPAGTFDADFGQPPVELKLTGQDFANVFQADRQRPASPWGALWTWRDPANAAPPDPIPFLIGVRPGVPGANNTVVDYDYEVPKRGTQIESSEGG
jgi:hypothetical protein